LVENPLLTREHAHARLIDREPSRAIYLGKLRHRSRSRRPFDRERRAHDARRVAVAFDRESMHDLSAALFHRRKRDRVARSDHDARLLVELPYGRVERALTVSELAFGNRPGAVILLCPVGSSGMHEKDLEVSISTPPKQDARAFLRHPVQSTS